MAVRNQAKNIPARPAQENVPVRVDSDQFRTGITEVISASPSLRKEESGEAERLRGD